MPSLRLQIDCPSTAYDPGSVCIILLPTRQIARVGQIRYSTFRSLPEQLQSLALSYAEHTCTNDEVDMTVLSPQRRVITSA